jgi:hypothetical protein
MGSRPIYLACADAFGQQRRQQRQKMRAADREYWWMVVDIISEVLDGTTL